LLSHSAACCLVPRRAGPNTSRIVLLADWYIDRPHYRTGTRYCRSKLAGKTSGETAAHIRFSLSPDCWHASHGSRAEGQTGDPLPRRRSVEGRDSVARFSREHMVRPAIARSFAARCRCRWSRSRRYRGSIEPRRAQPSSAPRAAWCAVPIGGTDLFRFDTGIAGPDEVAPDVVSPAVGPGPCLKKTPAGGDTGVSERAIQGKDDV
jgi:hypothetical protein